MHASKTARWIFCFTAFTQRLGGRWLGRNISCVHWTAEWDGMGLIVYGFWEEVELSASICGPLAAIDGSIYIPNGRKSAYYFTVGEGGKRSLYFSSAGFSLSWGGVSEIL